MSVSRTHWLSNIAEQRTRNIWTFSTCFPILVAWLTRVSRVWRLPQGDHTCNLRSSPLVCPLSSDSTPFYSRSSASRSQETRRKVAPETYHLYTSQIKHPWSESHTDRCEKHHKRGSHAPKGKALAYLDFFFKSPHCRIKSPSVKYFLQGYHIAIFRTFAIRWKGSRERPGTRLDLKLELAQFILLTMWRIQCSHYYLHFKTDDVLFVLIC